MAPLASFHLVSVRSAAAPVALARLATDRPSLRRTPGLRFWRLLGTGSGSDTGPGVDLRRTALFAVWEDDAAYDRFLAARRARWAAAVESYHVALRPLGGHGRWHGTDVLGLLGDPVTLPAGSPVAILTRANVRAARWRRFTASSRRVSGEVAVADGLLAVCGIGEAPVGRQATFSLWRSLDDARRFAGSCPHHTAAVRATRAEDWYGEELFARFAPIRSTGTWNGRDPLAP